MNKHEIITGLFSFIVLMSFGAGIGIVTLYNQGDLFSLFFVFVNVFGTSFFISGIKNQINIDIFIEDIFLGIAGVAISGIVLFLGTYETLAAVSSFCIFGIAMFKITRKQKEDSEPAGSDQSEKADASSSDWPLTFCI